MSNINTARAELNTARAFFAEGEFLKAARWAYGAQCEANRCRSLKAPRIAADAHAFAVIAASRVIASDAANPVKSEAGRIKKFSQVSFKGCAN